MIIPCHGIPHPTNAQAYYTLCPQKSKARKFLSRVSIVTRDIDIAILSVSVCLSVRLFVTFRYYANSLTYCHSFPPQVAQSFQFYQHLTSSRNSNGIAARGSAKYRLGIKISRFFTISRDISQTIQNIVIVTIEGEQETAPKLLNGTSFNDLE